mmetsp:Transcript_25188/g.37069  ORF Transcript_25188/g.37069 Transcript_25188/m.37069 type:complete len:420 (+) Transcript_25188:66-1325(+)|eukprot:CAMPEP_0195522584 /NCGR_PEP_ID=MMETSP0794_2-20130614/20865_1 /TAXON_ID=515487 /ORGANISM="Stephanopyxis turris, Strain CCMP 815" /LENGTH=419 /DNA_ID=CAMNT_0040652371 /DNA_START=66 /DNA_END=1325 /DNA_ORIENTATION=+
MATIIFGALRILQATFDQAELNMCTECQEPITKDTLDSDRPPPEYTPSTHEIPFKTQNNSLLHDMVTPFFLIAAILFILALCYSVTFLCIVRFGTFQPEYNRRFIRGRVVFCSGRCFLPICLCLRLHPVGDDRAFMRAIEGGGLSREERREALLVLLAPMCKIMPERETQKKPPPQSTGLVENEGNVSSSAGLGEVENPNDLDPKETDDENIVSQMRSPSSRSLVSSHGSPDDASLGDESACNNRDRYARCMKNRAGISIGSTKTGSKSSLLDDNETDSKSSLLDTNVPAEANPLVAQDETREFNAENDIETGTEADECCCVCMEEYLEGQTYVITPRCEHQFHRDCLLEWLEVHNNITCPSCREEIIQNEEVVETAKRLKKEKAGNGRKNRWIWNSLPRNRRTTSAEVNRGGTDSSNV